MFTVAGRVPPAAAARQRRPPADAAGPARRPGRRRRLGAACSARNRPSPTLTDYLRDAPPRAATRWSTGCGGPRSTGRSCASWTPALRELADAPPDVVEQVVLEAKYAGYIDRQAAQVERFQRLESRPIPAHFDYAAVPQLRAEAREKLGRIRPASLGPGEPHQRHQPGRPGSAAVLSRVRSGMRQSEPSGNREQDLGNDRDAGPGNMGKDAMRSQAIPIREASEQQRSGDRRQDSRHGVICHDRAKFDDRAQCAWIARKCV